MERTPPFSQQFQRLKASPLARTLGSYFLILFVIQGLVVAWLTFDVWQAEQQASREYRLLMASEQIATISDELRKHRRLVDYWRDKSIDGVAIRKFQESRLGLLRSGQDFARSREEAGLPPERSQQMINMIAEICEVGSRMFNPASSGDSREGAHQLFRKAYEHLYYLGLGEINAIRDQIYRNRAGLPDTKSGATDLSNVRRPSTDSPEDAASKRFKVDPLLVLALAALANVGFGVYIAFYADKHLSGRIIRLAEMCDSLSRAEELPAPKERRNEVDTLQQTFHEISLKIAEIEKGRKSYIHLLKDLQGAALERGRAKLQELASRQTDKRREDRFIMLKTSVGGMIHLLETMTEGLQYNAEQELRPQFQTMSTTSILAQAVASVQALLDKKKITVNVLDPSVDVQVDAHLINRLIVNLLSNAVKFSPKESTIELRGQVDSSGSNLRCEIKDAGPGISEDDQKKLFKPFSQVGQDDEIKRSGTGLGLMICKQIVTAHGGSIGCTSKPQEGATFWFVLPLNQSSVSGGSGMMPGPSAGGSSDPGGAGILPPPVAALRNPGANSLPKKKSMTSALILAVFIFSIAQTSLAFALGSKIDDVEKRTKSYLEQQQLVIESERFMGLFLTWRVKAKDAVQEWNEKALRNSYQMLEDQKKLVDKLAGMTKDEPELHSSFVECKRRLNFLSKTTKMVLERFSKLSMFALAETVRRADMIGMQIEDQIFYQLRIEKGKLEMTYGLADQLRAELIPIILLSGLVNAILIVWLSSFVLRLLNRTSELTEKAKDFASGGTPTVSISSNDELSYLDKSLCAAAASIRNAERQRQQLLSIVNHDLRTPLASVLGGLEIVKAGILGELPAEDLEVVDQADREMRIHLNQINDLLALEQLEAGSLEPKNESVVLSEALEDAVDLCRGKWRGRVELEFSVSPELEDFKVTGETELLTRMFKAVIENAFQATERAKALPQSSDSGKLPPVKVSLRKENEQVIVSIIDSADGVPDELRTQLFDRFRFVNDQPLTGMGLPLAYRLAKLQAANLLVTSSANGTKASFVF
ncbi:MAG: hypothetical protein K2X77_29320 [Candidatus Obscuribacterales bacterium]|jgi:signal transduction histidine kinase|nr:hypothetical protein [Candidatus Obscuribacterales bacterium]